MNEELGTSQHQRYPALSVPFALLTQMERLCGSMSNIASWVDQLLATLAVASSGVNQSVFVFLAALATGNKDILCPAEELRCRFFYVEEAGGS